LRAIVGLDIIAPMFPTFV